MNLTTKDEEVKQKTKSLVAGSTKIRLMKIDDFELVRGWCINEGWNIGLHDKLAYYKADTEGHLIHLENNIPIGSISLIKHTNNFFTIGPFIVKSDYRTKGYGTKIWNRALMRLNGNVEATILLYAVPTQMNYYKRLGFTQQFINQRWQLTTPHNFPLSEKFKCEKITDRLLTKVSQYDKTVFSASREIIFANILNQPDVKGFLIQDDNNVRGFGIVRPCVTGFKIGPLVAETFDIAQCLFAALANSVEKGPIIMDIPDINKQGEKLMTYFGLSRITNNDTIAMTKGQLVPNFTGNFSKHYAIFSLEIG